MLSTTERSLSSDLLRTAYRLWSHTPRMDIAGKIRTARGKTDLSQRDVAKKLKVSPSAVAQWELGDTMPTIAKRVDLAQLLNIPFSELLPEAGKITEMAVKDPQVLAIIAQLQELPLPVREAILMQAAATAEALRGPAPPGMPALESKKRRRR